MKAEFGWIQPIWFQISAHLSFKFPWDEKKKSQRVLAVSRGLLFLPIWFQIGFFWCHLFRLLNMLLGLLPGICRDAYRLHWDVTSPRTFLSPLPFFFRATDEEKRYKSVVWDGRRCREKTWMSSELQGWRRLLVGSYFWRRKKQKKVKQVLQQGLF